MTQRAYFRAKRAYFRVKRALLGGVPPNRPLYPLVPLGPLPQYLTKSLGIPRVF